MDEKNELLQQFFDKFRTTVRATLRINVKGRVSRQGKVQIPKLYYDEFGSFLETQFDSKWKERQFEVGISVFKDIFGKEYTHKVKYVNVGIKTSKRTSTTTKKVEQD